MGHHVITPQCVVACVCVLQERIVYRRMPVKEVLPPVRKCKNFNELWEMYCRDLSTLCAWLRQNLPAAVC